MLNINPEKKSFAKSSLLSLSPLKIESVHNWPNCPSDWWTLSDCDDCRKKEGKENTFL